MERGQFTFYRSFWEALRELPGKDKTTVICAICAYVFDGAEPDLRGTSKAIFSLIKPTLDTASRRSENGRLGGSKDKANAKQTASKHEANAKQTASEKEREKEAEIEKEIEGERENECSPPIPPSRTARKKHGEYGWVLLTEEEHDRLLNELGAAELDRCIRYVDEAAQASGNKNRWKDWNLVIRKCNRERWGMRHEGRGDRGHTGDPAGSSAGRDWGPLESIPLD